MRPYLNSAYFPHANIHYAHSYNALIFILRILLMCPLPNDLRIVGGHKFTLSTMSDGFTGTV
jgi:hypothetical protein